MNPLRTQRVGGHGNRERRVDTARQSGEALLKIINDNKPVVNVKVQYASALPEGIKSWAQMGGWQRPKGTIYELTAKNAYVQPSSAALRSSQVTNLHYSDTAIIEAALVNPRLLKRLKHEGVVGEGIPETGDQIGRAHV